MKENSTSKRFRTSNKKRQQKIIASLLTGAFFLQQSIMLNTFASEISGISGNNGVFNINPEKLLMESASGGMKNLILMRVMLRT